MLKSSNDTARSDTVQEAFSFRSRYSMRPRLMRALRTLSSGAGPSAAFAGAAAGAAAGALDISVS